ncbi:MAG: hypothetical protein ACR2JY_16015 [Chloroflexota bacterium]
MSKEAGLRFWLDFAERHGALSEDDGAKALLLLPSGLQQTFHLPEEVAVTADPEVAEEEGAMLLIPGHPLLEQAAAQVLEQGDAGTGAVPWPRTTRPSPEALLAHARNQFLVEHGRIDPAGEPSPVYLPLLHIGALVSYVVDDRFQEVEAVWLDAGNGLPMVGVGRLADLAAPETGHPALLPDMPLALQEGHRLIEERAVVREQVLARQVQGVVQEELTRAGSYYEGVLQSISRRRSAASPERQALFDAQTEATQKERGRRVQEIEEKYRPRHDTRPFRLHLVLTPALQLPVHIRRGERRYPLALTWVLAGGRFTALRCPHCGTAAPLVAGREFLGCKVCLAPSAIVSPPPAPPRVAPATGAAALAVSKAAIGQLPQAPKKPARSPKPVADKPPVGPLEALEERYHRERQRAAKLGQQLAQEFWGNAGVGVLWPRKQIAPDSPLAALYRLYGAAGPLFAVGIPPGHSPLRLSMRTNDPDLLFNTATSGWLEVGPTSYPYALRWHLGERQPIVFEVLPFAQFPFSAADDGRLPSITYAHPAALANLLEKAPRPHTLLDPVAAAIWDLDLPVVGLPIVVRCLTAWWRLGGQAAPALPPRVLAAALVSLVAPRSGHRRTRQVIADHYSVAAADVQAATKSLQALLKLAIGRAW